MKIPVGNSIMFKPICGKCGADILEYPRLIRSHGTHMNGLEHAMTISVYPYACPKCKAAFTNIILPEAIETKDELSQ